MLNYDEMPEDNELLANVEVSFPRLEPDDEVSCPASIDALLAYLNVECADPGSATAKQLTFLRTAEVEKQRYWIWEFREQDGTKCYATVSQSATGETCIGYDEDYYGLSPEQFILGDYHNVF